MLINKNYSQTYKTHVTKSIKILPFWIWGQNIKLQNWPFNNLFLMKVSFFLLILSFMRYYIWFSERKLKADKSQRIEEREDTKLNKEKNIYPLGQWYQTKKIEQDNNANACNILERERVFFEARERESLLTLYLKR